MLRNVRLHFSFLKRPKFPLVFWTLSYFFSPGPSFIIDFGSVFLFAQVWVCLPKNFKIHRQSIRHHINPNSFFFGRTDSHSDVSQSPGISCIIGAIWPPNREMQSKANNRLYIVFDRMLQLVLFGFRQLYSAPRLFNFPRTAILVLLALNICSYCLRATAHPAFPRMLDFFWRWFEPCRRCVQKWHWPHHLTLLGKAVCLNGASLQVSMIQMTLPCRTFSWPDYWPILLCSRSHVWLFVFFWGQLVHYFFYIFFKNISRSIVKIFFFCEKKDASRKTFCFDHFPIAVMRVHKVVLTRRV